MEYWLSNARLLEWLPLWFSRYRLVTHGVSDTLCRWIKLEALLAVQRKDGDYRSNRRAHDHALIVPAAHHNFLYGGNITGDAVIAVGP